MDGLIVGFTTSLPLLLIVGPISLMVLDTGLTTGLRNGWPAPLGVATVDLTYASVTAAAGLGLQRLLSAHAHALSLTGGLALLALALYLPRPAPVGLATRFAALCAINPLTLVAFATLAVSAGTNLGAGWVVGIVGASLLVHGGFLAAGDALGRVLTPALIHRGRMLGCLGVAALGVHTLLGVN